MTSHVIDDLAPEAATAATRTVVETFEFASIVDQAPVFVRRWRPQHDELRTAVQISHGIAEHSGRYDRFARFLAGQGHVVYALDLRGHGNTAGPDKLGHAGINAWAKMTSDIRQLSGIIRDHHPELPLVAFGHSMGSALTQFHIQNHGGILAGAILCGTLGAFPGVDPDTFERLVNELRRTVAGGQAHVPCPFFGALLGRLNAPFLDGVAAPTGCEWQTSDPAEIERFLADPLCGAPFSNAMSLSIAVGLRDLWDPERERLVPPGLPLLVIAGTEDPVGGNTTTVRALIERYVHHGHLALSYRFYAGARHEILNEPVGDLVHRDVEHWLSHVVDG